jgi:hypothetical protein
MSGYKVSGGFMELDDTEDNEREPGGRFRPLSPCYRAGVSIGAAQLLRPPPIMQSSWREISISFNSRK